MRSPDPETIAQWFPNLPADYRQHFPPDWDNLRLHQALQEAFDCGEVLLQALEAYLRQHPQYSVGHLYVALHALRYRLVKRHPEYDIPEVSRDAVPGESSAGCAGSGLGPGAGPGPGAGGSPEAGGDGVLSVASVGSRTVPQVEHST